MKNVVLLILLAIIIITGFIFIKFINTPMSELPLWAWWLLK